MRTSSRRDRGDDAYGLFASIGASSVAHLDLVGNGSSGRASLAGSSSEPEIFHSPSTLR